MMYNQNLVAVLKCNGKILREDKDLVTLPFGSEYSILLKNLDTRKAVVKIQIDGKDVLDGNSLVLYPGTEHELKGFLTGSQVKNRFRFIQKTKEIQDYRGDRLDDGIIRIEYRFEKQIEKRTIINEYKNYYNCSKNCFCCSVLYCPYRYNNYNTTWIYNSNTITSDSRNLGAATNTPNFTFSNLTNMVAENKSGGGSNYPSQIISCNYVNNSPLEDEGITVKGSDVSQHFAYTSTEELEETSKVIILRLRGTKETGKFIEKPITVKTKLICSTCGKKSKSYVKYCSRCGSFLE